MAVTQQPPQSSRTRVTPIRPRGRGPFLLRFWRTAVGKKWVMAVTGLLLLGFVLVHMVGNLKVYISKEELNLYGEALRDLGGHLVPRTTVLWAFRLGLVAAFGLHIVAAAQLTLMNRRARPVGYQSPRDYAASSFAGRTMRWTGVIILAYLLFHLADLTWGNANDEFVRGDPYNNLVYSLQRPVVAAVYAVANIALAIHILHGAWSLFQSLGWNNPRYNAARRLFAQGFAAIVLVGNLSFPILIQAGVVDLECPREVAERAGVAYDPELSCEELLEPAADAETPTEGFGPPAGADADEEGGR